MTKQRKLPLIIHVKPETFCVLNKICRFCPACELVIARQAEIEDMLLSLVGDGRAAIAKERYLVVGTLDRADWRAGQKEEWSPTDAIERSWLFKDHWDFEVRGGWGPAGGW